MDAKLLAGMAQMMQDEHGIGKAMIGIIIHKGFTQLHIDHEKLEQVAPLSEWNLNQDNGDKIYPYKHTYKMGDVIWMAMSSEPINVPEPVQS